MRFLKPGKGVPKEKRNLNGFMQYFSSVYHNFTKIFMLNFISLPVFILYAFFMEGIKNELGVPAGYGYIFNILSLLIFTLVGISPVSMGASYVCTRFAKDEPCFFLSDFKDSVKDNLKESLIMLVINIVVFYFFTVGYRFYFLNGTGSDLMKGLYTLAGIMYLLIHIFANYLAVNYKLKVKDIYKKAFIFTLVNLPQNLLILAGLVLIYGLCFFITTLLGYLISGVVAYSFSYLLITLYAEKTVKKYAA